jgi:hypothetical protein
VSSLMTRPERAEKVLQLVEAFVKEQEVSCSEAIYQNDNVIVGAYEFIDQLCEVAGFHKFEEENE